MAAKRCSTNLLDLPPDVMLLILGRFNHSERLSLSLVSKSFRSHTDRFVSKLTFLKPLIPSDSAFRKLLARFPSVTRIAVRSTRIAAHVLTLIADSGVKIERLEICKNPRGRHLVTLAAGRRPGEVKGIEFGWYVKAPEVAEFVPLLHSLEELDLSCSRWTDAGIRKLALQCRNLRKVSLNFIMRVTDRSLDALATCVNLEHVRFKGCEGITFQGVLGFLHKAKNLKSLELPRDLFSNEQEPHLLTLANNRPVCDNLSHLSIDGGLLTDGFLLAIAGIRAPLTNMKLQLVIVQHPSYTMTGLSAMLRAFPGLTRLDLHLPWPGSDAQDRELSQLVKFLPRLKDVQLVSWSALCLTLFSLINNCSFLECINIKCMDRYTRWDMPQQIRKNDSIQHINIDPWPDTLSRTDLKSPCLSLITLSM